MATISYARHRFPAVVIQHAVWLHFRFTLSYRDVEDLLAERGIDVSYETVRRWVTAFGPRHARRLRATRPMPNSTWHLDEMFVSIDGRKMYLWRAVDAEGEVLDILVQSKRDKRAAKRLMRGLLRKNGMRPSSLVTDRLSSYGAALAELGLSKKHVRGRRMNNRVESSHVPIRRRERKAQGFRSPGSAQRFLSTHAAVYNTFNTCRHLVSANSNRELLTAVFATWREAVGVAV